MERIQCRQTDSGNSYRWTLSPDGTEINSMDLDGTSNKYVIDGRNLSITLSNVTGEDGGLYRCAYGDGSVTPELCIKVYGESKLSAQIRLILLLGALNLRADLEQGEEGEEGLVVILTPSFVYERV